MGPILLTWRTCSLPSRPAAPPGGLRPRPPKHPGSPQWEPVSSIRTSHGAASVGVPQHPPGRAQLFSFCWLFMMMPVSNPGGFQVHPSMMNPVHPGQSCCEGTHPGCRVGGGRVVCPGQAQGTSATGALATSCHLPASLGPRPGTGSPLRL